MEPQDPREAGTRQQLLRNLRLGGLLVVLLVGLLGGFRIWQLQFSVRDFIVRVEPERDVTGARTSGLFQIDELLEYFEFELRATNGDRLLEVAAPIRGDHVVAAKGSARQKELENGRAAAFLHYPGADADRMRFPVGRVERVEDTDSLRVWIDRQSAADLQAERVVARLAVRNQHGDPIAGLKDRSQRLRADAGASGAYTIQLEVQDLLDLIHTSRRDSLTFIASAESAEFRLAVPVRWFLSEHGAEHVLRLEQLRERVVLRARPTSMRPASVTVGGGWNGEIQLRGRDVDLLERAALVGPSGRVELRLGARSSESLLLQSPDSRLNPGRYGLELEDAEGPVDFGSTLSVIGGLRLREPEDGTKIAQGEDLRIRWSAPSAQGAAEIRAARQGTDAWFDVYRGGVEAGAASLSTADLEPGEYRLRLRVPDRSDLSPITRRFEVLPPPTLLVRLRFTLRGQGYGRIKELRVDGEIVDMGNDLFLIPISVEPGSHSIRVTGVGISPTLRNILVEEDGQVFPLELEG